MRLVNQFTHYREDVLIKSHITSIVSVGGISTINWFETDTCKKDKNVTQLIKTMILSDCYSVK